jgi:hypothetical protein
MRNGAKRDIVLIQGGGWASEMRSSRLGIATFYVCLSLGSPAAAQPLVEPPGPPPGRQDALQCWWRTSTPAVTVGEPFSVLLTCAAVDTPNLAILVDAAKLSADAMPLAPFEVLGGAEPAELRAADRRFFQREYRVRLLSDTSFGSDVPIPPVSIAYRIQTRTEEGAWVQGIERRHEVPPLAVRLMSLVPPDARDIRDQTDTTFAELDTAAFRASALRTTGSVVIAIGGLLVALALAARPARARPDAARPIALDDRQVLRRVADELAGVRQRREESGWTGEGVDRALASLRIAASYALSRLPAQREVASRPRRIEGAIVHRAARGRHIVVSAAVTPETIMRERTLAASEDRAADASHLERLEALHEALARFTSASYAARPSLDSDALDRALAVATRLVQTELRGRGRLARATAAVSSRARDRWPPWSR